MQVVNILGADIYRDGGSYGFWFDADDGQWYEFFIKTLAFQGKDVKSEANYAAPVIYREGANSKDIVRRMSWSEAKEFLAQLSYDNQRFRELLTIVNNDGRRG